MDGQQLRQRIERVLNESPAVLATHGRKLSEVVEDILIDDLITVIHGILKIYDESDDAEVRKDACSSMRNVFRQIRQAADGCVYRACVACGNGVRHSYSVFLSQGEVLCYDCAAKEIKRLRESEAEWVAGDDEGRV